MDDNAVQAARLLDQPIERGVRGVGHGGALGALARAHDSLFAVVSTITAVARRWPAATRTGL